MAGISYSDSVLDYDKSTRLPIDDVAKNTEDPIIPELIINLSDLAKKDAGVMKISTENRLEDNDFPDDGYPERGEDQPVYIADLIHEDDVTSSSLPGEEFGSAIEAYDNMNIDFSNYVQMGNRAVDTLDQMDKINDSIKEVDENNLGLIKISTEYLYKQLGINPPLIISTEGFEEVSPIIYKNAVVESIKDTVVKGYQRVIEFIKNVWSTLVNGLKKLFNTVYDFIKRIATSLGLRNEKAPNAAQELMSDKYESLKTQLVEAFSKSNRLDSRDVTTILNDQIKTKDFYNYLNANSLQHVFELIHSSDDSINFRDYREFFKNTFLNKILEQIKDLQFVGGAKIDLEDSKAGRVSFTYHPNKNVSSPEITIGDKSSIKDIIQKVLYSNDIVKTFYVKVEAIEKSKNEVLNKLSLDFSKFGSKNTIEVNKHISKILTLFFMDLASLIKDITHLSSNGNRLALKYCEYSIRVREGKA